MATLISLKTFCDARGNLTVIEKVIPFNIKRLFYIYGVDSSVRGGHRHKKTVQAAVCLKGSCKIFCDDSHCQEEFILDSPSKCLILYPEDWHKMYDFEKDSILMVLASEYFDLDDYIYLDYK